MNRRFNIEAVQGEIIGDFTRKVALFAPNGNKQREATIGTSDDAAIWAKEEKARLLAQPCGDGKPLSAHTHLVATIYGNGQWEVRIYD